MADEPINERPRTRSSEVNQDDLPANTPPDDEDDVPAQPSGGDDDFDQGHGDGGLVGGPPSDEDVGVNMGVGAGPAISDNPQMGFGEEVLNIEEPSNHAVWALLEQRRKLLQAHKDFDKAVRDVKKAFVYDGVDKVLRYGHHTIKITATPASTKEISFTRGAGHRTHFGYKEPVDVG